MTAVDPGRLLVDGDARDAVESALDRNLFVEAGAGTGKTTVLVRRVVRLFATGHLPDPSGLVAITFTEAAAAELRARIRSALDHAAADDRRDPVERERCLAAARRIDEAVITTLHGFAQRILAEHPLEAGLPPAFEVAEGIPAELELADRWGAFVDDLFADEDLGDDLVAAITLGLSLDRLREVATAFCDRWDRVGQATFADPGPAPEVDPTPVTDALRAALDLLGHRRGSGDRLAVLLEEEVRPALAAIEAAAETGDRHELLHALDVVKLPKAAGLGRKEVWGDDKLAVAEHLALAADRRAELLDGLRRHLLGRLLPRLARFALGWAEERAAAGELRYHDLLVLARRLLWQPDGRIRRRLAERFRVLLVDEFQDTDPIQVKLVVALAAADPAAPLPARWQDVELGPGRVVVVGDPKQSIYGFRGADVTLWNDVRARFAADVVSLSQNFRSVAGILRFVNHVFDELMGDGDRPTQPPYVPLDPARAEDGPDPVAAFGGPAAEGTRAAEVRLAEAADVAAAIAEVHASGVRYGDVALLLPTRTPLGSIERALDDAGIPYRIESQSLVWSTDVVRELLAVLRAIEDPADEVAVVAALRSPAFACRDDELVDFRRSGGRWDPTAPQPEDLDPEHPVAAALSWLGEQHRRRWWEPVNELVERVVRQRRLVEATFAQRRPRDHWRRLRFVVDQARAFVEAGGASLAEFLAWADLQAEEGAAAVEAVVPEHDDDAVRILTVHGSKGLEFPVVVLAGLTAGGAPSGARVLWGDAGPEVRITVRDRPGVAFQTAGWEALAEATKQADEDEGIRLLYVAATRARDRLLVSVHHQPAKTPTHAQLLFERCEALGVPRRPRVAAEPPAELLAPGAGAAPAPPAVTVEELRAATAAAEAAAERTWRSWVVAPTAVAHGGPDGAGDRDDDAEPAEPGARPADPDVPDVDGAARSHRGGSAVGRAVHAVLEEVPLPPPPGAVAGLAARHAAAEGVAAAQVAELAEAALASPALADAVAARRLWREVPVVAAVGDRLVDGVVDLLYETAAGDLVVVDWKTDHAGTAADVDAAMDRYRLQGAAYAVALEAATGRRVAAARFVFCRAGVERTVAGAELAAAAEEVRRRLAEA